MGFYFLSIVIAFHRPPPKVQAMNVRNSGKRIDCQTSFISISSCSRRRRRRRWTSKAQRYNFLCAWNRLKGAPKMNRVKHKGLMFQMVQFCVRLHSLKFHLTAFFLFVLISLSFHFGVLFHFIYQRSEEEKNILLLFQCCFCVCLLKLVLRILLRVRPQHTHKRAHAHNFRF